MRHNIKTIILVLTFFIILLVTIGSVNSPHSNLVTLNGSNDNSTYTQRNNINIDKPAEKISSEAKIITTRNSRMQFDKMNNMSERQVSHRDDQLENMSFIRDDMRSKMQTFRETPPGHERRNMAIQFRMSYEESNLAFHEMNEMVKSKQVSPHSDIFIESSRAHLNSTIDYMITQLEDAKHNAYEMENMEAYIEVIDHYIDLLESQRNRVGNIDNINQLINSSQDVRNIWHDANEQAIHISLKLSSQRIEQYLNRSNKNVNVIEKKIHQFSDDGKDVHELELLYDDYLEILEIIETEHQFALEKIDHTNNDSNSLKEANKYFQSTKDHLAMSNSILKEISILLAEMRREDINSSDKK